MFLSFSKPKNIEEWLRAGIKLLLALSLFTTLILNFNFYFPFIVPKILVWRAMIELAFVAYIFLIVRNKSYWPQFNKALPLFILFIFTLFISSIFGENFAFSFWSNYERMDGLINWIHILMYVFTLLGVLRSKEEWRAFFNIFIINAWLIALYTFGQYLIHQGVFYSDFFKFPPVGHRLYSTLGNAAYLGSYMMIAIAITFYNFIYRLKKGWQWFSPNFWILVWYILSMIVFSLNMGLSQTRASLLGLIIFFFLLTIFYLWFNRKKRNLFYYIIIGSLLFSITFISFAFTQKESGWVQNIKILDRLTDISLDDTTTETRLMTWRNSLEGFKEKPILGWGEENFKYVFDKNFPIEIYKSSTSEIWFDRPHNILMQHLIHGGIVGLLLYLSVFAYVIFALLRNYKKQNKAESFFGALMKCKNHWFFNYFWIAFLVSFLVHDMFIFDNLNVNTILYLVFAYLFTIGVRVKKPEKAKFRFGGIRDYTLVLLFILLWLVMFMFFVYKPGATNRSLIGSLKRMVVAESVDEARELGSIWIDEKELLPLGDKERTEIGLKLITSVTANKILTTEEKQTFLVEFLPHLEEDFLIATEKYPNDVRVKMFLVQFYGFVRNYEAAIAILEEVKEIAPKRPESYMKLTQFYVQLGEIKKAEENIEYYASIVPKENHSTFVYWNAFQTNVFMNDIDDIRYYLDLIVESNQEVYQKDFLDKEILTLREFVSRAEANNQLEIAAVLNSYLP